MKAFCPSLRLLGLAAALSAAPTVGLATDSVSELLPLSLEDLIATPVITASRRQEGREKTPAHIMVITREQMRDRRYKSLADLLEDLPGVDFQRGTRSSQYNNFVFQGHVSNNKLLILLDGVRIDHPAGGKIPIAENFSLYFAKQVEVLYGPAAALYGADAFAGVINIITEKAEGASGKVSAGFGSFGSLEGDFLTSGKLGENFSLTAGAHYQQSDRAKLDKYYAKDYPKVDAKTFAGNTVIPAAAREDYVGGISSQSQYFRLDAGDRLTVGFYRNRFKSLTSTGDTTASALYLDNARWDTTIDTWYGKYRFDISSSLSSETVIDYSRYEIDPQSRYLNIFTDFQNEGYDYSKARRQGIEQNFNWRASDEHAVLAGLAYRDYYALETPDLPRPYDTSKGPREQGVNYPNTTLPVQGFETSYYSWSGYVQWQAQWTPTLSTMVGVRQDWYSTYGSSTNPRLGIVWQAVPGSYLKLLYGEAFRAPSPDESVSAFGSFTGAKDGSGRYIGVNFRVPNTALEPEKSKNLSLTWDWRPRKDFNLVSNLYHAKVTDVIVTSNETVSTQNIPGAILSKTSAKQNGGRDDYVGVDLIPQWQIHLAGAWTADLWGSYSYIKGTTQDSLNGIEWDQTYIATHKLKLGTTFRYQDWLTVTPRLQWIGETNTGVKNTLAPGERLKTDAHTLASLHLGIHKLAGEHLSLYVDIYNLFDERYYAAHGSSSTTMIQVPQQPRTFMGTVEYRF
ncbi:TonB-dependent receptor plug domain-containing protein [Dechloromonas denitrificans]|uniref:TonB-dependent receptor plug domain-containing protein n=1 Tax=Dechloromonas denitrificans TaxID=281362 RepID=UPI001CFAAFD6|nr:TonB-dependent receptor [Dechloromonas denitrificans]UCV07360.1 TonB-dependent receptor [Dechloromonas denitrificans]